MSPHLIRMIAATVFWCAGFTVFGRFVSPRWKVAGKLVFYLAACWALSMVVGNWSLVWIVGHPLLGILGHAWWCRRHDINWITCEPRDRYLELRPWAHRDGFGGRETITTSKR